MGIFTGLFDSFVLRFFSNREITFDLGDTMKPMFSSYSSRIYSPFTLDKENIVVQSQNNITNKINQNSTVFVTDKIENFKIIDNSCLYVFLYQNSSDYDNIFKYYKRFLRDSNILSIMMPNHCYKFINHFLNKNSKIFIYVENVESFGIRMFFISILAVILLFLHLGCKRIIDHISRFDPVFTDFNIVSSNITKYKDLKRRDMSDCTICFEEFIPDTDVRVLECNHYFHPQCIDRWLIGHLRKCPCCRSEIEINEQV